MDMDMDHVHAPLLTWTLRLKCGCPRCTLKDGSPWRVIVEKNNRVSHNDRLPLLDGWNFCQYLRTRRCPPWPPRAVPSERGRAVPTVLMTD